MQAGLCNAHFYDLLLEFNQLFRDVKPEIADPDPYRRMTQIANYIANQQNFYRFLSQRMIFIKCHVARLRHGETLSDGAVRKCILFLADININLELITKYEGVDTEACAAAARNFYSIYHDFARITMKVTGLPPKELFESIATPDSSSSSSGVKLVNPAIVAPSLMPPGQTIKWYQQGGFRDALRQQIFVPASGPYAGQKCRLVRFNGNNAKIARCGSTESKYTKSSTILNWES
jgi:hypothetical protein